MKLFSIMCIVLLTGCPFITVIEHDECDSCHRECDDGPSACDECELTRDECHNMNQETPDA